MGPLGVRDDTVRIILGPSDNIRLHLYSYYHCYRLGGGGDLGSLGLQGVFSDYRVGIKDFFPKAHSKPLNPKLQSSAGRLAPLCKTLRVNYGWTSCI